MPYKRCWACKQKIILWWSKWPGRNAVLSRFCYLWRWQFNSSNLLLTFIAPLRNWPNSTKSFRRLKVFNFSLEYKTFCELIWNLNFSKTFHVWNGGARKPNDFFEQTFQSSFLSLLPFIFKYSITDVLTTL